jgi:hypothetical protein
VRGHDTIIKGCGGGDRGGGQAVRRGHAVAGSGGGPRPATTGGDRPALARKQRAQAGVRCGRHCCPKQGRGSR